MNYIWFLRVITNVKDLHEFLKIHKEIYNEKVNNNLWYHLKSLHQFLIPTLMSGHESVQTMLFWHSQMHKYELRPQNFPVKLYSKVIWWCLIHAPHDISDVSLERELSDGPVSPDPPLLRVDVVAQGGEELLQNILVILQPGHQGAPHGVSPPHQLHPLLVSRTWKYWH